MNKLEKLVNDFVIAAGKITEVEVTQVEAVYDDMGISLEATTFGGVRIKAVDELIQDWLDSGDKDKQKVVDMQNDNYCFKRPNIDYLPEQLQQIEMNQTKNWASSRYGGQINNYYLMNPLYRNKHNHKEVLYRRMTPAEFMSGNWEKIQQRIISPIKNHSCVTNGNYSNPYHPKWKSNLVDKIVVWVKKKMEYELENINKPNFYKPVNK